MNFKEVKRWRKKEKRVKETYKRKRVKQCIDEETSKDLTGP